MHSPLFIVVIAAILLLVDGYLLHGLRAALADKALIHRKSFNIFYWVFCVGLTLGLLICVYYKVGVGVRAAFMMVYFILQVAKLCFLPFMVVDDVRRYLINRTAKRKS